MTIQEIVQTSIAFLIFGGLIYWGWAQMPPEPEENVEARERHGRVSEEEVTAVVTKNKIH